MRKILTGIGVVLVLGVLASMGGMFSALQTSTPTVVSYCGDADWFDQFQDQEGYTPNARCTGVQIEDTRIDVSVSTWDGSWGCYTDYTAYTVDDNGGLTKEAEFSEEATVNGITIDKSGYRFASYDCQWVQTDYEISFPGNVTIDTQAADQVRDGETLTVTIPVRNNFEYPVSGSVSAELLGSDGTVSRTGEVSVPAKSSRTVVFTAPAAKLGQGNASITTSFDGKMTGVFRDWQGVNLDCDSDGTIEQVEDCRGEGLAVNGQGASADVDIQPPTVRTQLERFVDTVRSRVSMAVAALLHGEGPEKSE